MAKRRKADKKVTKEPTKKEPLKLNDKKRAEYMQLLALHNQNRIDYNDRKWETIKFGQTVVGAVYVTAIALILTAAKFDLLQYRGITLLIASLFLIVGITCFVTVKNLSRESKLLFFEEGAMFKIAHLLNLNIELPEDKQWIPGDAHLLSEKWRKSDYGTEKKEHDPSPAFENWAGMRTRGHFYSLWYGFLFLLFAVIALIAAAAVLRYGASWDQPSKTGMANQAIRVNQVDSFDQLDSNVIRFVIPDQNGAGTEVYACFSHPEESAPVVRVFVDSEPAEGQPRRNGTKANTKSKEDNP